MKVGDAVRLVHGKESGRIVAIIDHKHVEVEIEDGFRIPVAKMELVVVNTNESVSFSESIETFTKEVPWKGVYLAFLKFNDQVYEVYLINDNGYKTFFTIGEERDTQYKGIFAGSIEPEGCTKLMEVNIKDFDHWPEYVIQLLFFNYGDSIPRPALSKRLRIRSAAFFKSEKLAPILNKSAHLFRLDLDALMVDVKAVEIGMQDSKAVSVLSISKPTREIDLHIEKLTEKSTGMSNSAMLSLQMDTFHKNLENGIAAQMDELVFIHGVGNGVLKREIHKVLSGHKSIAFFQEAQKDKFGYGATLVKFK